MWGVSDLNIRILVFPFSSTYIDIHINNQSTEDKGHKENVKPYIIGALAYVLQIALIKVRYASGILEETF